MTEEMKEVSWDEATKSGDYISLEEGETKVIHIKEWKLVEIEKFDKKQVELQARCVEEDGEAVEKKFTTTSNRLKKKLRPLLEEADVSAGVKLSIVKVGDKFTTQYSVKSMP